MDVRSIAPRLAAGGIAPTGETWVYRTPVDDAVLEAATTCWVVPFLVDGRTAAVWMSSGRLHIPGGTLEPGESWRDGAERELLEELGAPVRSIEVFGAIVSNDRVRLTAWADIGEPAGTSEPDREGTHVIEVRAGSPDEIIHAFDDDNQTVLADIYRLALALRPPATSANQAH